MSKCEQSKTNGRAHTSNCQPLCRGRPALMCTYPMGVKDGTNTEQKLATIVYTRPYARTAGTSIRGPTVRRGPTIRRGPTFRGPPSGDPPSRTKKVINCQGSPPQEHLSKSTSLKEHIVRTKPANSQDKTVQVTRSLHPKKVQDAYTIMCILLQHGTWWSTCASQRSQKNKGSTGPFRGRGKYAYIAIRSIPAI